MGVRVWVLEFGDMGFKAKDFGCRVLGEDLGFRILDIRSRVLGFGCLV